MRDVAVAVALYNNEKEVIDFAKKLLKQNIIDRIQFLVTCNACKDVKKFKDELLCVLPSALIFDPGENLGYLNGCLYGVKKAGNAFSWVMVSNTDIEFVESSFFEKAVDNISEDIWCIGPDITLSATGIHQNPFLHERPSKRKLLIWNVAYSNYLFFMLYFKLSKLKPKRVQRNTKKFGAVYAVHGSCFLLRRECVKSILTKCKGIFMYGEELLVAETIYRNHKKTYCNLSIGAIHNENQVTGTIGMKKKQKWFKKSITYLINDIYMTENIKGITNDRNIL